MLGEKCDFGFRGERTQNINKLRRFVISSAFFFISYLLQYTSHRIHISYNIMLSLSPKRTISPSLIVSPSKRQKTPSPQKLLLKGIFVASRFESKLKSLGATPGQQTSVDVCHAQSGAAENPSIEQVSPWSHSPSLHARSNSTLASRYLAIYCPPSSYNIVPSRYQTPFLVD